MSFILGFRYCSRVSVAQWRLCVVGTVVSEILKLAQNLLILIKGLQINHRASRLHNRLAGPLEIHTHRHDQSEYASCNWLPSQPINTDSLYPLGQQSFWLLLYIAETFLEPYVEVWRWLRSRPRIEHVHGGTEALKFVLTSGT